MGSTPQFARTDTQKPDGFYVQFERVLVDDETAGPPDKMMDGYWPSLDPASAGYIGDKTTAELKRETAKAKARITRWQNNGWRYVGVRARAKCLIVENGVGTYINIDSPGLWGIESDSGKYLDEVYAEEIDEVKGMIEAMKNPIYE